MINQLFSKQPDNELVLKCLRVLGWDSLDDQRVFIRSDLESRNVLAMYKLLIPDLREYYLPCKQKQYLSIQSIKSVITLQRQLLKLVNYTIIGTECVINNKKNMTYKLAKKQPVNKITLLCPVAQSAIPFKLNSKQIPSVREFNKQSQSASKCQADPVLPVSTYGIINNEIKTKAHIVAWN